MLKRLFPAVAVLLFCCGCSATLLKDGCYRTGLPGRHDMATVYGEQIFLRLHNPEVQGTAGGYWEWGGKYQLDDQNNIELKMDRQTKRLWKFHFAMRYRDNDIEIRDFSNDSTFPLVLDADSSGKRNKEKEKQLNNKAADDSDDDDTVIEPMQ